MQTPDHVGVSLGVFRCRQVPWPAQGHTGGLVGSVSCGHVGVFTHGHQCRPCWWAQLRSWPVEHQGRGSSRAAGAGSFFRLTMRKEGQPGGVVLPFFQLPPAEEQSAFPLFTALQCLSSAFFRFLPFAGSFLPYASTPLDGWKRKGGDMRQTPSRCRGSVQWVLPAVVGATWSAVRGVLAGSSGHCSRSPCCAPCPARPAACVRCGTWCWAP